MTGSMTSLKDTLFEQLERLNDSSLSPDELKAEIDRSNAMGKLSSQIIQCGALALKAAQFRDECLSDNPSLPRYLEE